MPPPPELINLPHALTEMLVKGRTDYERAVRAVRWGELPIWAIASAQSLPAAEAFGYAFEDLVGQPVTVREASSFRDGALAMLRPGSVVLAFEDNPIATAAAQTARKRGSQVLTIGPASAPPDADLPSAPPPAPSPLALSVPYAGAASEGGAGAACLQHAAAAQLALICAKQLARPQPRLSTWENDWRDLPSNLDRILGQLGDGVAALARELEGLSPILVAGSGCCTAVARRMASLARQQTKRTVIGLDLSELAGGWLAAATSKTAVVLLGPPGGRASKSDLEWATLVKERGIPLYVVAGSNQHELIRQARLSLMLPETSDLAGSILALAVGGWIGSRMASPARKRPADAFTR